MAVDVVMPQMGESIFEGTITKWLKKPGDKVERDEPLFEISTDKVDAEIPSPSAGVLKEIKIPEGQTVPIQTVVAVIDGAGAAAASAPAPAAAPPAACGKDPRPRQRPALRPYASCRRNPRRLPAPASPPSPGRMPRAPCRKRTAALPARPSAYIPPRWFAALAKEHNIDSDHAGRDGRGRAHHQGRYRSRDRRAVPRGSGGLRHRGD